MSAVRYHRGTVTRLVLLGLPLVVLMLATGDFVATALLAGEGLVIDETRLAEWALESIGLTALVLLVTRYGRSVGAALLAAAVAWVFRGPLVLVALWRLGSPDPASLQQLSVWLVAYLAAGLCLGLLVPSSEAANRSSGTGPGAAGVTESDDRVVPSPVEDTDRSLDRT